MPKLFAGDPLDGIALDRERNVFLGDSQAQAVMVKLVFTGQQQ